MLHHTEMSVAYRQVLCPLFWGPPSTSTATAFSTITLLTLAEVRHGLIFNIYACFFSIGLCTMYYDMQIGSLQRGRSFGSSLFSKHKKCARGFCRHQPAVGRRMVDYKSCDTQYEQPVSHISYFVDTRLVESKRHWRPLLSHGNKLILPYSLQISPCSMSYDFHYGTGIRWCLASTGLLHG